MIWTRRAIILSAGLMLAWIGYHTLVPPGPPQPTFADIAYGAQSVRQQLDIYLPEGPRPFPVVIDIHGGSFRTGDKAEQIIPSAFLDRGIAIASLNYRLTSEAPWPAQQEDILTAVNFILSEGGAFGLDPARFALFGQSAGGFLALTSAIKLSAAGVPPAAVLAFYPITDLGTIDAELATLGRRSPLGPADVPDSPFSALIGKPLELYRAEASAISPLGALSRLPLGQSLPPLFLRHGALDEVVAPAQSDRLAVTWRRIDPDAEVDHAVLPDWGHAGGRFYRDEVIAPATAFLARALLP